LQKPGFGAIYHVTYYILNQISTYHSGDVGCRYQGEEEDQGIQTKAERWLKINILISGSIAGLSLLFQPPENRKTIALYLFTRLLQCLYNESKSLGMWRSSSARLLQSNGDSLLFILGCAQVIYAYVMHPDTLPTSYLKFVSKSGPIDDRTLDAVRK